MKKQNIFGIVVKKRLVELGMSQRELSKQLGMHEVYLSMVLKGERTGEKYKAKIIKFLGLEKVG